MCHTDWLRQIYCFFLFCFVLFWQKSFLFQITSANVLMRGTWPVTDNYKTGGKKSHAGASQIWRTCHLTAAFFAKRITHFYQSDTQKAWIGLRCFLHCVFLCVISWTRALQRFLKVASKYSFSQTPKLLLLAGLPGPASVAWLHECNSLKSSLHNRKLLSLFPAQHATLP